MKLRLGSTSYVYPADIITNIQRLAGLVKDVELVLFEVTDASNLPNAQMVAELRKIAIDWGLSYTVHLPLNLQLGSGDKERIASVKKARRIIQSTLELKPWAYIVHLNPDGASSWAQWQERCAWALEELADEVGEPTVLAIENLENCPLERLAPILEWVSVSLCFDAGHLWLTGTDPLPALKAYLKRTQVIHLHGAAHRDHLSLTHAPPDSLRAILKELLLQKYEGVVTLEVFSTEDFFPSRELVLSMLREIEKWGQS